MKKVYCVLSTLIRKIFRMRLRFNRLQWDFQQYQKKHASSPHFGKTVASHEKTKECAQERV